MSENCHSMYNMIVNTVFIKWLGHGPFPSSGITDNLLMVDNNFTPILLPVFCNKSEVLNDHRITATLCNSQTRHFD